MTTVGEVMSSNLVTVPASATVAEGATVMGGRSVGSVLVQEGEELVGIFTERDIVRALSQDFDAPRHPLADWMTRNPLTIGPGASVEEALGVMLKGGFRHLPVVESGKTVGVISMRDISKATSERSDS
jgi:CBS domain-containing protein